MDKIINIGNKQKNNNMEVMVFLYFYRNNANHFKIIILKVHQY